MDVRRIAGDEAAADPHPLDHALLHRERGHPGGRRHLHLAAQRLGQLAGQPDADGLRVVRVRHVLGVHHPPLARFRERDQQQCALAAADQVVAVPGQVRGELNVGVQPDLSGLAEQAQPQLLAHGAAAAVGADQPGHGQFLVVAVQGPEPDRDPVAPARQLPELDPPLDPAPLLQHGGAQHLFGDDLVDHQRVWVVGGQRVVVGVEADQSAAVLVQAEVLHSAAPWQQVVDHPHLVVDLHGAGVGGERPAGGGRAGRAVHDPHLHTSAQQFVRHGQPHRARSDDQHLRLTHARLRRGATRRTSSRVSAWPRCCRLPRPG